MTDIGKVMACVDLSDYTRMTIEEAVTVTRGLPAEIVLLNVINNRDVEAVRTVSPYLPEGLSVETYIERASTERREHIKEIIDQFFPAEKPRMRIVIHVGIPYEAILRAIETEKVDLVVLASKGKSNLIGTLHGSNAEKVFRHSPVPVLSARSRENFSRKRF
ncbi:universal stress protein [Desulfopila sp. IMCC35006]|uniref:universal stress protein n=1 Tax=Desulfopila sp. IMCC35006 TaxID=2569542 RepID=UPI0010AC00BF|nr:universal stress protein [Desulfopila sp. IMCC35006]TKB27527.1 universal stress protein [Desulfopila sp. IMCC35006]